MLSPRSRIKVLATPALLRAAQTSSLEALTKGPLEILTQALSRIPAEPSWVVVEPGAKPSLEDEGRTRRLPGPFRYWAIHDSHESGCRCGCGGVPVVTFLLPEAY